MILPSFVEHQDHLRGGPFDTIGSEPKRKAGGASLQLTDRELWTDQFFSSGGSRDPWLLWR